MKNSLYVKKKKKKIKLGSQVETSIWTNKNKQKKHKKTHINNHSSNILCADMHSHLIFLSIHFKHRNSSLAIDLVSGRMFPNTFCLQAGSHLFVFFKCQLHPQDFVFKYHLCSLDLTFLKSSWGHTNTELLLAAMQNRCSCFHSRKKRQVFHNKDIIRYLCHSSRSHSVCNTHEHRKQLTIENIIAFIFFTFLAAWGTRTWHNGDQNKLSRCVSVCVCG